jgi:three-Cys-motif partner protein
MSDLEVGSDGRLARVVGSWSEEKLFYIQRYIDIFTTGMKNLWLRRVYIDLFSGPGVCRIAKTDTEIPGSPLLALQTKEPFTHAFLNDKDERAIEALRARTNESAIEVQLMNLDCNDAARVIADSGELDSPRTLGLAVIDPTAFQIRLDALEYMTQGRRIDLIVTLMTSHLRRFIGEPGFERSLDGFFGSTGWRDIAEVRAAGGKVTYRKLLDFYAERLKSIGYKVVDDDVNILNSRQTIYHLVFATKDDRGADFFKKISRRRFTGQGKLL